MNKTPDSNQKKPEVSVQVIFMNEEEHLADCINSILKQSFTDFELVIIGSPSKDRSDEIAKSFKDKRIRYFMLDVALPISEARNYGLNKMEGKYLFFTDADCVADERWIENGLAYLNSGCLGVEGKIIYMNKDRTVADKYVENYGTERGMTANIGYHADAIKKFGFNSKMKNMMEDRELCLKVMKEGKVIYGENMVVYHKSEKWTYKSLVARHKAQAISWVYLYKDFRDKAYIKGIILFPNHLATLLFPPLLILKGMRDKVRDWYDVRILLSYYCAYFVERINIWKTALKEHVFLI